MKYTLQIFTGSWNESRYRPEEVIGRIRGISRRIQVDRVIIGWNAEPAVYRALGAFLHDAGIGMLLWLPVFSEIDGISDPDKAWDIFGEPVPRPALREGEGFLFHCPSSGRNRQIVKDIYEKLFSECGFDGVFLDRVRSQSFASGMPGVLSCGCERCRKAFLERGLDPDAVRKRYEQVKEAFFDMASYPADGRFVCREEMAQRFFDVKEAIIADAVADLSGYFKGRGMTVGLDLFAPLVSRFVGQNYLLLAKHVDFIKPMLYRRTEAPAGIGYEYALYEEHARKGGRQARPMDRAFLDSQLEAVRKVPCGQYPGIEINYDAELVRTDAGYIRESLTAVRDQGFTGAVLCWDMMQAPGELLFAACGI